MGRFSCAAKKIIVLFISISSFYSPASQAESFITAVSIEQENGISVYKSSYLGGYEFRLDSNWLNVKNQNIQNKANILVFINKSDNTESITFNIYETPDKEKDKPFEIKQKLENSLRKKAINFSNIISGTPEINGKKVELATAYLDNNRAMTMVAMRYDDLSLIGTMGYPKNRINDTSDLITLFNSFKKAKNRKEGVYIEGEIVVGFDKGVSKEEAEKTLSKYKLKFANTSHINLGKDFFYETGEKYIIEVSEGEEDYWINKLKDEKKIKEVNRHPDRSRVIVD